MKVTSTVNTSTTSRFKLYVSYKLTANQPTNQPTNQPN
jgi:hypothetical protein